MKPYCVGEKVVISVNNLPEFYALLSQAEKEAEQLRKTLHKLSCFGLEVSFERKSQDRSKPSGR